MAMIALKCPHIEVSEPRQRARAFFISLFSFSPKKSEKKSSLLSLRAHESARDPPRIVFLSRRWCLSPSLSLSCSRVSFEISFHRREGEARAPFFYLSFKGASMGKM